MKKNESSSMSACAPPLLLPLATESCTHVNISCSCCRECVPSSCTSSWRLCRKESCSCPAELFFSYREMEMEKKEKVSA